MPALLCCVVPALAVLLGESKTMTITSSNQSYILNLGGKEWVRFSAPELGDGIAPEVQISDAVGGWKRVRLVWRLSAPVQQDELAIRFSVAFDPDFWWAPHLAPENGFCIAQHVFRSPAIIASRGGDAFCLIPDLAICGKEEQTPWFMDVDAPARTCWLGMTKTDIPEHVLYRKRPGMTFPVGEVELGFYVIAYSDTQDPPNPWQHIVKFLWEQYGHPLYLEGQPSTVPLDPFIEHTYRWAFDTWKDAVWQEFDLEGKRVGAPCFIVNVTQSPNYPGQQNFRESLSIWNQAWFSSLRSASGVMRYARRLGDSPWGLELRKKAELTKEFALAAPMENGVFPTVYVTEMFDHEVDGKTYRRTKGWETAQWRNSNRTPVERGINDEWYHVLDMSWTCLLMLRWYEEIEQDSRLLDYSQRYAARLLELQDADGFFPAWLAPGTHEPADVLRQSPETSMSVTFLLKLASLTGKDEYRRAGLRAMDAVLREIVPQGRWEDFETYWSCCRWGTREYVDKRISRSAMFKQCTFSMFWTAEALLDAYRVTRDPRYLGWGRRTLDELSMFQQVWQPPFIHVPALGGFGVMNCDGEWNDARQSLFAELFLDYYRETGDADLFERGVAALKASFVMMYCPENPEAKRLWEKVWPFFGPADYGFTMENYGHGGAVSREGEGIGEFTIYDWGNGAASEARNRVWDHYGDVYIDRLRNQAFGIDSVAVRPLGQGWILADLANTPRDIRVVFEDGISRVVRLEGSLEIRFDEGK